MISIRIIAFLLSFSLLVSGVTAQDLQSEESESFSLLLEAHKLLKEAKPSKALLLFEKVDSLSRIACDRESIYKSQYGILYANLKLGNAPFVLQRIDSIIRSCEQELGDKNNTLAKLYYISAIIDHEFRESKGTAEKCMKAVEVFENHLPSSKLDIAYCYNLMGISFYRKKDFTRALEYYQKSLLLKQEVNGKNHYSLATNYNNIGIIYALTSEPEKAVEYYKKSLAIKVERFGNDHPSVSNTQFNIGEVYIGQGLYKKALPYTLESIRINRINEEQQSFKLAHRMTSLAILYYHLGEEEKAIKTGRESIFYYEKSQNGNFYEATGYQGLGSLYAKMNQYENAILQYQNALEKLDEDQWNKSSHGNPVITPEISSERLYQILSKKAAVYDSWAEEQDSIYLLERALETREALIQAIYYIQHDISENESSFDFLEDIRPIYEAALENCYQLYEKTNNKEFVDRAFHIYTSSRAILLKQQFQEQQAKIRSKIPDSLLMKSSRLQDSIDQYSLQLKNAVDEKQIAELKDVVFKLKLEQSKLELHFERKFSLFRTSQLSITEINISDFLSNQKNDSNAVFAWFYGKDKMYFFHNQLDQLHFMRLDKSEGLDEEIIALNELAKNSKRAEAQGNSVELFQEFSSMSHSIYRQLFPFQLKESKSITLITDGLLNLIPFELLIDNNDETAEIVDYSQLPYLLKKAPISYAYSPTFIDNPKKAKQAKFQESILVIAPTYREDARTLFASRVGFTALQFAQEEADFLEERFHAKVLRGDQASDIQFKKVASNHKILHFAMHAFSDDESPQYSSLIFIDYENPADQKNLHAYEISLMDIPAELVVLSACNTGSGKIVNGEGTISLARSFLEAGTQSVLMSLWQVDDKATSLIFKEFYENLDRGLPRDLSLQQAKLKYLEENKRNFPFYWASFILMGDKTTLTISSSMLPQIIGITCILLLLGFGLLYCRITSTD